MDRPRRRIPAKHISVKEVLPSPRNGKDAPYQQSSAQEALPPPSSEDMYSPMCRPIPAKNRDCSNTKQKQLVDSTMSACTNAKIKTFCSQLKSRKAGDHKALAACIKYGQQKRVRCSAVKQQSPEGKKRGGPLNRLDVQLSMSS